MAKQVADYHNEKLQSELSRIRVLYPHSNTIYADYYNADLQFYYSGTNFCILFLFNYPAKSFYNLVPKIFFATLTIGKKLHV